MPKFLAFEVQIAIFASRGSAPRTPLGAINPQIPELQYITYVLPRQIPQVSLPAEVALIRASSKKSTIYGVLLPPGLLVAKVGLFGANLLKQVAP